MNIIDKLFGRKAKVEDTPDSLPELMEQKICYPGYRNCSFRSLQDAVRSLMKDGFSLEYRLPDIIRFNVCCRDYLRKYGIRTLLKRMVMDVPELETEPEILGSIVRWYEKEGMNLAGYDLQCYDVKDTITVLGHEFRGLEDVVAHRSAYGRIGHSGLSLNDCAARKVVDGLFVSEFYERYPIFDSYDIGDDRTYQNYIFTVEPIDDEKLAEISGIRHNCNYSMVHENIPEHLLPILYYQGDGEYMILAAKK